MAEEKEFSLLRPANCVGVVDSDYRGEIMVLLIPCQTRLLLLLYYDVVFPLAKGAYKTITFLEARIDGKKQQAYRAHGQE